MNDRFGHTDYNPLCCCEYIDHEGERNHVLACCCNCYELDRICDRLVSCKAVRKGDISALTAVIMDRIRCPGRGGAFVIPSASYANLFPFIAQPLIAVSIVLIIGHAEICVSLLVITQAVIACYMAKRNARSQILYYWTIAAISYTIILFELSVIPMLEIRWDENLIIMALTLLTLGFLYLTKVNAGTAGGDGTNGTLIGNGVNIEVICNVCRIKVYPRCVHCTICQTCVPRYDYHCFWLDCCIGESNQAFFLFGSLFGTCSIVYGSLLMLTTICRPNFKFNILVPTDCSDALDELEIGLCYVAASYCLGMALLLLIHILEHLWLVSRGISGGEWSSHYYSICTPNPFSRGCCRNWFHLLSGLRKFRR